MKKRMIALSGIAIATLLTFNACDSTSRYDDEAGSGISNPSDGTDSGSVTTSPEPFTPNLPANGGSIVQPGDGNTTGDTNQTKDTYKTINGVYSIKIIPEYDSITSGQTQNVHYEVTNFFTKKPADDRAITYMNFEIDKRYAEFFDVTGNHGNVIEFGKGKANAKSTGDIALKSNSKSGQLLVNFNAVIDGTDVNLTKSFPIVVEKNKSSSMAIVPIGTTYADGLFTEKFVIHVVDSYGNKAKDGTRISTGVISNPKLYSKAYNGGMSEVAGVASAVDSRTLPRNRYQDIARLDYNPSYTTSTYFDENNESVTVFSFTSNQTVDYSTKDQRGSLNKSTSTFTLPASSIDTSKDVISSLDTLIVLANQEQHRPYNLGGWDISTVNNGSEVSLYDLDAGSDISNVSYVVGDEYRYDRCNETIMNAAASTFTSTEVKDGIAYAELRYVPAMVGKNVFIYANSKLDDKRIGISRKIILTGTGLEEATFSCKNESKKGSGQLVSCTERFRMIQKSSGKIARDVYVAQPTTTGVSNYYHATISRTGCNGWATVSIYGVPPEKTATVSFGSFISDELIVEQK